MHEKKCPNPARLEKTRIPLLGKGGVDAPSRKWPRSIERRGRGGSFNLQTTIGGLNEPPCLRPLRRLRDIFLLAAAIPPLPRRGIRPLAPLSQGSIIVSAEVLR